VAGEAAGCGASGSTADSARQQDSLSPRWATGLALPLGPADEQLRALYCDAAAMASRLRKPLSVRVLVLGDGPEATKLKLMQVAGTSPRTGDTEFIHSHTGFRYLTIMVDDTGAAVERLAKLGVKPLAKSPMALPESLAPGMYLTCVRDPDGNIVELLGPRK
jgi:catechol 2,3-dioxygenase-like lactoylglutathione lyase family enzyme